MRRTAPNRTGLRGKACAACALALAACGPEPRAATLDDALRAYDSGRFADALRLASEARAGSTDAALRQQASYVEGCAALELGRRDQAREAFVVSARSDDATVAGRSMVMQANMAAEDGRWSDAERAYLGAASRLRGRDAELAREQARGAGARAEAAAAPATLDGPLASNASADPPAPGREPSGEAPAGDEGDAAADGPGERRPDRLPAAPDDAPWTVSAGVFGTETAARTRAMNIAKATKAAKLPTPRVLAIESPSRRVWVVEVGSFTERAKADAALRKIPVGDARVVRSRVPAPPK